MKVLDKIIAAISPAWSLRRLRARQALDQFERSLKTAPRRPRDDAGWRAVDKRSAEMAERTRLAERGGRRWLQ